MPRLVYMSRDILYTGRPGQVIRPPEGCKIRAIPHEEIDGISARIAKTGLGQDMAYFSKGAVCYLATICGSPAGIGWRFPHSSLLRRLNIRKAGYLGGFLVLNEFRGLGIYPAMLSFAVNDLPAGIESAVVQTVESNHASRRGLEKAGFCEIGILNSLMVLGICVWSRIDDAWLVNSASDVLAGDPSDQLRRFITRFLSYYIIETRSSKCRLSAAGEMAMRPFREELKDIYSEVFIIFGSVEVCGKCLDSRCCSGDFGRMTVLDSILMSASDSEDYKWSYRLYPFRSYEKNRSDKGWCVCFRAGEGCSLEKSNRPARCVTYLCEDLKAGLGRGQLRQIRQLNRKIDGLLLRCAARLAFGRSMWDKR